MATQSELVKRGVIHDHDGEWKCYKVGRRCLSLLDPGQVDRTSLKKASPVSE